MGLEFSLPISLTYTSHPPRRSSKSSPTTYKNNKNNNNPPLSPSSTLANTLANRSDTPVARHVALARLAERLSAMAKSRRQRVIRQLHISPDVLREVRKYTPNNSFSTIDECDSDFDSDDSWHRPIHNTASLHNTQQRRKGVSFAKYAEMRLFRD